MYELPPISYYFKVEFLVPIGLITHRLQTINKNKEEGNQNQNLDMRFQKVSGFRINMSPHQLQEGGQNLFSHRLPMPYEYSNLVLERGLMKVSPLTIQFQEAMSIFRFTTTNVFVTLLNQNDDPVVGWIFINAYPVSWASSDLNADENKIVIDTLELAYTRYQRISL